MASILKRLRRSDSVKPTDDKSHDDAEAPSPISSAAERDLSRSFTEQHLNFEQLAKLHPKSRINVKNPKKTIGLSARDAADRLVTDGRNWLPPPKELSNWRLLLKQFLNFFWLLLVGAGILSLITYALDTTVPMNLYAGIVLFSIVIVMCTIQFLEEKKARNTVQGFKKLLPVSSTVIRDGKEKNISAEELVVGDVVQLRSGGQVPADVRIIYANGLKLETSSITGESEPSDYTSDAADENVSVFDSQNVAFNGSFCIDGEGVGVVIRTGTKTIIGRIASLTTDQKERKSSLERELDHFVAIISGFSVCMGVVIFVIGCIMTRFHNVLDTFINGFLVVIVACVPQGLPATVTTQLTIIARRMAKKNVYLKRLDVIEAFGACTVIASDKTGTLTKNSMTVTDLWYDKHYMSGCPDIKQRTLMKRKFAKNPLEMYEKPLPELITVSIMCNNAQIVRSGHTVNRSVRRMVDINRTRNESIKDDDTINSNAGMSMETSKEKHITGNPSEVALLRYTEQLVSSDMIRGRYQVVFEIPFNSKRKTHLIIVKQQSSGTDEEETKNEKKSSSKCTYELMMKGAPEMLAKHCSMLATEHADVELDDDLRMDFQDAYDHFGNEGRRVIGFAHKIFEAPSDIRFSMDEENYPIDGLTFLGMAAIMDPPREDAALAIQQCKTAGIKVYMVTGDHPSTAAAIARQVGLIGSTESVRGHRRHMNVSVVEADDKDWAIVHGESLAEMTQKQWDTLLETPYIVFSRTTPELKLLIVENCQKRGEIVAVTGDGVNDAPALKRADIGVAMGITGSDVAKQAADIVLMDDNFASIVKGIEEGRLLFDNLKKSIAYTLTHFPPEGWPIVMNFVLGMPAALSSLQILSVDLGTEMAPAISMAYENAERDIMNKPPRKKGNRLVSWAILSYSYLLAGSVVSIGCAFAYFSVYQYYGISPASLFYSNVNHFKKHASNFTSNGVTFDENEQISISLQASAAWHLTLVISQVYHIWTCTTRRVSLFQHGVHNLVMVFGVLIEVLLICLFVYVPGVRYIMGAEPPPIFVWAFSFGVGVVLLAFNETRKYFIRKNPYGKLVRLFKW